MNPPKPFSRLKFWRNHADEIKATVDFDSWGPHIVIGEFHFGLKAARDLQKWLSKAIAYMEKEIEESSIND